MAKQPPSQVAGRDYRTKLYFYFFLLQGVRGVGWPGPRYTEWDGWMHACKAGRRSDVRPLLRKKENHTVTAMENKKRG